MSRYNTTITDKDGSKKSGYIVDTFRQYNRVTTEYEYDAFYNGGAGC